VLKPRMCPCKSTVHVNHDETCIPALDKENVNTSIFWHQSENGPGIPCDQLNCKPPSLARHIATHTTLIRSLCITNVDLSSHSIISWLQEKSALQFLQPDTYACQAPLCTCSISCIPPARTGVFDIVLHLGKFAACVS
jgi:hypothetical protein